MSEMQAAASNLSLQKLQLPLILPILPPHHTLNRKVHPASYYSLEVIIIVYIICETNDKLVLFE